VYGHDDRPPTETVTLHIDLAKFPGAGYDRVVVAGREVARRPARDVPVRLTGAIVVEGGFDRSGGSAKNPALYYEGHRGSPGRTVLEVRDVPAGHADVQQPGVTVIDRQTLAGQRHVPTQPGDRPVVLATALELVRIAQGDPMVLPTLDGAEVQVRLYTPDELLAATAAAVAEVGGAELTREEAERLAAPLPDRFA
jgi:hypothetical protein